MTLKSIFNLILKANKYARNTNGMSAAVSLLKSAKEKKIASKIAGKIFLFSKNERNERKEANVNKVNCKSPLAGIHATDVTIIG